ncbi:MAG: LutB/LldF family L-lactate oxidation iron-sulfur protein [Burkholderiales bacterium]|nr:LutB/LldF family L-lactate oxidation iron-sulfur protein [Burkholderiales bacterium]
MRSQSMHFKARAGRALADVRLQDTLRRFGSGFAEKRAAARAAYGAEAFEELRAASAAIRDRGLEHLDAWLLRFEAEATRCGTEVRWAETAEDIRAHVLEICARHGLKKAIKSKSMVSEEAGLNAALEASGVQAVETDLGEYIIQLAGEAPSHIIAPAIHKDLEQVADLFAERHGRPRSTDIEKMTREARLMLREHFLSADLGISGGNFLVAETGSVALVTNEGNGRMVSTLPRVHVAITGIEKVIPTLEDLSTLNRVLPRSATGQDIENYFTVVTGPRRAGDADGPEHMIVILVDAGRTRLVGSDLKEMLRCIRCGACMNHCPVYHTVGGHAYGWVYPGPMGSVLTPVYNGIENALDLPQAATLCGACEVACPVQIPLPELLRRLREKQMERRLRPWGERLGFALWAYCARRPRLYALAASIGARVLKLLGGRRGRIARLPLAGGGWTRGRDMPAPEGRTFRSLYAARKFAAVYGERRLRGREDLAA